ncbi:MAG: hypothetical protein M3Y58_10265 [Chloroflexota bacterium]|nr:hypothetical protein [Chloroflexota bacterium]
MIATKEEIEQTLEVLVGMPLWGSHRAVHMQMFQFGRKIDDMMRDGRAVVIGEYTLHAQCAWRIVQAATIVVAANDRYLAAGDDPYKDDEDFDWEEQPNRLDERITPLFTAWAVNPPVVESVEADMVGSVRIALTRQYILDVFPSDSLEGEHWRLLPNSPKRNHFVVTDENIDL